ncbi:type II toxin-antitoxin system RelE/ParE family toxin [Pseudomonas coleopterorum]|uniref:Type II toxin-antitoxin system RelE/ParE family toxin n=1 Tax=Pseudomonas coleopterorum TaxID=1605838 RepID=A0ABR9BWA6_9PSED|nr:type II toxin-antitoxin system RelE/ParE family toxin [Pseudomonas coleopterorum]MBD8769324.1 type II toxin-antitoxin system RelE/ParE family toxin [Pseudomonas coleopterorum]
MRIEWLTKALKHLDHEASFIAKDNELAASQFVSAVREGVDRLSRFPALGRKGRVGGTREWIMPDWPYVIPYRIEGDRLIILHIFHTRRALPSDW